MRPETNEELYIRLMRRVRKTITTGDPLRTGCWLKTGQPSTRYPSISIRRQQRQDAAVSCHRLMWELTHGAPPPANKLVCHTCDQTNCINPSHLFLGTSLENQQDMTQKGRGRVGTKNGSAKLTEEDKAAIRRDYRRQDKSGTASSVALGQKYGVTSTTIQRVVGPTPVDEPTERIAQGRRWFYRYDGHEKSIVEWSRDNRCLVSYRCLKLRLWKGWSFARALTTPSLREPPNTDSIGMPSA